MTDTAVDAQSLEELQEMMILLAEAYEHYFDTTDGHCKSSEGSITLLIPPFFWDLSPDWRPGCIVYSYVLGPHRTHYFDTTTEALEAVRGWHRAEMDARRIQET